MEETRKLIFDELKILAFLLVALFIMFLGGLLNQLAFQSNGQKMPFYSEDRNFKSMDNIHFRFDDFDEVNYPYLTDLFKFSTDKEGIYSFVSIGDFLIKVGEYASISGFLLLILFIIWKGLNLNKNPKKKELKTTRY
jgi:hypothetical protein